MQKGPDSATSLASDDSEPPEAVELTSEYEPPLHAQVASVPETCRAAEDEKDDQVPPAPVTIITGCLGAGKTTLVHKILTGDHGLKIAVFMNEFAEEQDLERQMLGRHEGEKMFALEEWVELANGCLCCSLKDDFLRALEALMEQRQRFDYILVETTGAVFAATSVMVDTTPHSSVCTATGLADPGPIASALWTDAELHSSVCLDSIVTVVDAHNLKKQLQEGGQAGDVNEAERQIAFADTILLNKVDLVDAEDLAECLCMIKGINSDAAVMQTQHSSVHVTRLLNQGVYRQESASGNSSDTIRLKSSTSATPAAKGETNRRAEASSTRSQQDGRSSHGSSPPHLSAQEHADPHHHSEAHRRGHTSRVTTVALHPSGPVPLQRLREWLEDVLWEEGTGLGEVYRMKGVVAVQGSHRLHIVQAVRELYDITEGPVVSEGDCPHTRLVLIGRGLQTAELQSSFCRSMQAL